MTSPNDDIDLTTDVNKKKSKLPRGVKMIDVGGRIIFARYYGGFWTPLPDDEAIRLAEELSNG